MNDDPTPSVRNRAYELADTGRYADWGAVAEELVKEGVPEVLVRRVARDTLFQVMLKNRIASAR